jgi:signal transduction histidine kinase
VSANELPIDGAAEPEGEPHRPVRFAMRGLADGRDARRILAMRLLFLIGLFAWASLAAWWATYFYRSSLEVRDSTLRAYRAEEQLDARDIFFATADKEQAAKWLHDSVFTFSAWPLNADEQEFPFTRIQDSNGLYRDYAIVVKPEERERLRNQLRRKMIMLAGEGSLLIGLLLACLMVMYRMLSAELLLRRQQESFVHSVTHELKSPLTGLRSLLQSLATLEIPKDDRKAYLDMGVDEIDRLDHLVANILLSSRIDARAFRPSVTNVDITSSVKRLSEKKARLFEEHGGELKVELPANLLAKTDQESLETILGNIVDNALKYSAERPVVAISAREAGKRIFIDVKDNGIGLAGGDESRIFNRFYRTPSGEKSKAKGSGLGLFIARGLARSLGGDVTAHSDGPGRGTTFSIRLPAV